MAVKLLFTYFYHCSQITAAVRLSSEETTFPHNQ